MTTLSARLKLTTFSFLLLFSVPGVDKRSEQNRDRRTLSRASGRRASA